MSFIDKSLVITSGSAINPKTRAKEPIGYERLSFQVNISTLDHVIELEGHRERFHLNNHTSIIKGSRHISGGSDISI